jgi:hypothetical protein
MKININLKSILYLLIFVQIESSCVIIYHTNHLINIYLAYSFFNYLVFP